MARAQIIVFPVRHRGDPEPRRFALVTIGFRWREGAWRRGRVVVSDAAIDAMPAPVWEQSLRRWTRRRPRGAGDRALPGPGGTPPGWACRVA